MRVLLRKIHGVFGATIGGSPMPSGYTVVMAPPTGSLFGGLALFVVAALAFLLLIVGLATTHTGHGVHVGGATLAFTAATGDIGKIVTDIKSAFEQFKNANDERLKEVEKKGAASADVQANVDKANGSITELSNKLTEVQKQLRDVETAQARALDVSAPKLTDEQRNDVRAYLAFSRKQPIATITEVNDADVKSFKAYGAAFDAMMRLGAEGLTGDVRAALQTGSDPSGGFFITPDRTGRIVRFITDESPIREYASVQMTGKDAVEGELDMDEDLDSGWVGDTEARPETGTPRGPGLWRIPMQAQYAAPKTTQDVLDDADTDPGAWLEAKLGRRFARQEQVTFHSGSGIKKAKGFLVYASVSGKPTAASAQAWQVIEAKKSGQNGAFAASAPGDKLVDLVSALHPNYRGNANWFMPRLTVAEVRKLKDGQGNYLWQPNFGERTGGQLLGFNIVEDEGMPAIATNAYGIAFGDMKSAYQIIDHKVGMRVLRDAFTNKPWVIFYTTKRVGGDVVDFQALKLFQFAA